MTDPDPKALKILFNTFWSSSGWKDGKNRTIPAEDFEHAKSAGLMFPSSSFTHDEIVAKAIHVAKAITPQHVADAFLSSLGSRQLQWRSALGSYAVLSLLPEHELEGDRNCCTCGEHPKSDDEDWNVLNFERHKWGGVRHSQIPYAWFDLQQLKSSPPPEPSEEDIGILRTILQAVESAPSATTANKLEKRLGPLLKSNKDERGILIAILGLAGILETSEHPGFRRSFIRADQRDLPSRHFVDMAYPACWWRRTDGVNQEAVSYWFGHRLGEL